MDDETRRVGEIEAEIAETRVELTETIEAIQERLSPSNIVAQAKDTMRQAATEKVRDMTDNTFMDTVRSNPIPAAMIGIGAAWLYWKGRSDDNGSRRYSRDWRSARGYNPGTYGAGSREYAVGTSGPGTYGGETDGSESAYGSETYRGTQGSMGVGARAHEMTEDLRDTARHATRRAQLKFNDVLRDNPLMLGAAAALVGAAVGMSIPATEAENHLMGEARDTVVERAQGMASQAAEKVSEAAGSVADTANKVAGTASEISSSTEPSSTGGTSTSRRSRTPRQA